MGWAGKSSPGWPGMRGGLCTANPPKPPSWCGGLCPLEALMGPPGPALPPQPGASSPRGRPARGRSSQEAPRRAGPRGAGKGSLASLALRPRLPERSHGGDCFFNSLLIDMKQKGCRFAEISELTLGSYRLNRGAALQACVGSWFTEGAFRERLWGWKGGLRAAVEQVPRRTPPQPSAREGPPGRRQVHLRPG